MIERLEAKYDFSSISGPRRAIELFVPERSVATDLDIL
jgi:hypothetical protein